MAVNFFQKGHITFGTVELDAGLGELVQGLGQVQGLHTAQLGTHSFHSLYNRAELEPVLRIWIQQICATFYSQLTSSIPLGLREERTFVATCYSQLT